MQSGMQSFNLLLITQTGCVLLGYWTVPLHRCHVCKKQQAEGTGFVVAFCNLLLHIGSYQLQDLEKGLKQGLALCHTLHLVTWYIRPTARQEQDHEACAVSLPIACS